MSLSVDQFQQIVANENAFIIDTRDEALFLEGYVPNSIHFKPEIIHQAAALGLLSFEQPLVFVGDNDNEKIAIAYFEKLGFSHIKGWLDGGFAAWRNADKRYDLIIEVEADELAMDIPFDEFLMVLDIRTEEQYDAGHLKDAIHIPLLDFADPGSMSELDEHFNIYLISQDGQTNTLAASILKRQGIHNIRVVKQGWEDILLLKDRFTIELTKKNKSVDNTDAI
ncbi:MAG: rhodanese-like domain-containing protein [Bacteroidetes bacterium]|nr:rhodanese-like domain-containing protein [Bacteroidota bacterium]